MGRQNYQLKCDEILKQIEHNEYRPKLLLHTCCAPCSSYVLEYLAKYFEITVFYFNPNIDTLEEYEHRYREQQELIKKMNLPCHFLGLDYQPGVYYSAIKGLEKEKEGGKRCDVCFELRLRKTAEFAKTNGFDYFTTSLSISPLKNSETLNALGLQLADEYGVKYLTSDFKKRGGYLRSVELSKQFDMYRQDYCGCIFSKMERENARKEKERV